jgi:hypothetical protein
MMLTLPSETHDSDAVPTVVKAVKSITSVGFHIVTLVVGLDTQVLALTRHNEKPVGVPDESNCHSTVEPADDVLPVFV